MDIDIIKTKNMIGSDGTTVYALSLVYNDGDAKYYEVHFGEPQTGDDWFIREEFSTKKGGLKAYDEIEKEVRDKIKKGEY